MWTVEIGPTHELQAGFDIGSIEIVGRPISHLTHYGKYTKLSFCELYFIYYYDTTSLHTKERKYLGGWVARYNRQVDISLQTHSMQNDIQWYMQEF